jgi:hypothetical protein
MINFLAQETAELGKVLENLQDFEQNFDVAKQLAKLLGVHFSKGKTSFVFWTPEINLEKKFENTLEIYCPKLEINFFKNEQTIDFQVVSFHLKQINEIIFGVFEGIKVGNKNQIGDFYDLFYLDKKNQKCRIADPLAYSTPFGAFSPAEIFDIQSVTQERKDYFYLKNLQGKVQKPANILEIHLPTASEGGTLADLADFYKKINQTIDNQGFTSDFEKAYLAYDAVELLPLQVLAEHENKPPFWQEKYRTENIISVNLQKPDTQNWGYDILIAASSAINPNLLATKRPHELLDFIETMHTFSEKPMQVYLDVVYGHSDSQGAKVLNKKFIAGDGMYGKVLNFKHLLVRAILLESMRRMLQYGIDGFRIDASQDINNYNSDTKKIEYDADFLKEITLLKAEVSDVIYKPFIIFEDGRPWPEIGWALKQTYREVTKMLPETIQWSPLTFADNNPHIFNFWQHKFHRIKEIAEYGEHWLTGSSNHDSLRKGATQNPYEQATNVFLGEKINQIFHKGYNAPATKLLENFLPGTPMDFLQANVAAPWTFMRNTDDEWGLKIISEEANFFHWFISEQQFEEKYLFKSLKNNGLDNYFLLKNFITDLPQIVKLCDYKWEDMLAIIKLKGRGYYPIFKTKSELQFFAKNYMQDIHDFCNVCHAEKYFSQNIESELFFQIRKFRARNNWLSKNLFQEDIVEIIPKYGATVYHISRENIANGETWIFYGNMEGDKITLQIPDNQGIVMKTNNISFHKNEMTLGNSEAIIFKK